MKIITKSEIINQIWNDNIETYKKKDIEFIINSFIKIIGNEIRKGFKVKIEGLGTFSTYLKNVYIEKTLNTGNSNNIPAVKCISFKPSKKLKD